MAALELNLSASKFISSLVKSLQIICNGHVDFAESIELVGHINVRIDHKFKFNYIVDEQVSKEGEDCSTTFLSNSYHSTPPSQHVSGRDNNTHQDNELTLASVSVGSYKPQLSKSGVDVTFVEGGKSEIINQNYAVNVGPSKEKDNQESPVVFKLEDSGDSNDGMVLPTTAGDYEAVEESCLETIPSGPGASSQELHGEMKTRKRRRANEECGETNTSETIEGSCPSLEKKQESAAINKVKPVDNNFESSACDESLAKFSPKSTLQLPESCPQAEENNETGKAFAESGSHLKEFKELVVKLTSMCNIPILQNELLAMAQNRYMIPSADEIKAAKKKFLENFDKEKLKKVKEVLKMKKGKQKKLRLKTLLAESGLSNEQLLILAQDSSVYKRKISWKSMPDGPNKEAMLRDHKKLMRMKTQERQQRLLEMAEMLKRNQSNDPGITVISKDGGKRCTLHKSSVSVVSHNIYQLSVDNIDEVAEALTGKTTKMFLLQNKMQDKSKEKLKIEQNRKTCIKKKMKQIVGKMLAEVSDAGYRVLVTSTVGSEAGSHSAELCVSPLKVDDFFPETKESEVKPELSEEEYAKQLEREQIIEKQKMNEEKMKEIEAKLIRILSGAEEIFIPTRKRYSPGEPRPSDAERMKEYRKRLKQDPEKYQVYKQKRAMNKKWRKLGQLAAKVKVNAPGATLTVIPASVNEEPHAQPMGTIVNINPPVGNVNMHCSQVFEHPTTHQPSASVVNVHHTNQYVGQVSGMHATHQQPITYGNEMEFVELIAATHNVQNQHFG